MFPQERVQLHTLDILTCSAKVCQTHKLNGYQIIVMCSKEEIVVDR
jgi:hypothetical protein